MKKEFIMMWLIGLMSADAQEVDAIDLRAIGRVPHDRAEGILVEGEASPYGLPAQRKKQASNVKRANSQEDQIREILLSLPVTGVIGHGKKVLLGDLILQEGEFVEDVLPGQTERLLVKEISQDSILIEWVEQSRRKSPRQLPIPIDMKTRVQVMLKGQGRLGRDEKRMGIARTEEEDQ